MHQQPPPTLPSNAALSARLGKLSARLLNLTRANKTIRLLRKSTERHFDLAELAALSDGGARVAKMLDFIIRGKSVVLTTARDTVVADNDSKHDDESVELWQEVRDAEYDAQEQATAKAAAAQLAESERLALAELGATPPPADPTTNPPPPATELVNAEYVTDSEDEVADDARPVVVRNWLRRRKLTGFERFDRNLAKVRSFTDSVETETGSRDLQFGWPFLCGVCADMDLTYLQAPLVLFPVRLVKERSPQARWIVEARDDADPQFNETLARAFETYHKVTLPEDFFEAVSEIASSDPRELPTFLATELAKLGITLDPTPFESSVQILPEYRSGEIPREPKGSFAIRNHGVIGYFPQADSALRLDYEQMKSTVDGGGNLSGHVSMLLAAMEESESGEPGGHAAPPDSALGLGATDGVSDQSSEADQWFVLDTDSSQEEVLLAARREPRLVVHGPPGTGKSQVIVNLISDALKRGERVALVCQKRAALDVVFQRLDAVGLSKHVALVHDYVGDRRLLYQRISSVVTENPTRTSLSVRELEGNISRLATRIDEHSARLGLLARELHLPRACGFSARQLYTRLSTIPQYQRTHPPEADKLAPTLKRDSLEALQRKLDSLESVHREIDTVNHPWAARTSFAGLGQSDRRRIHEVVDGAIAACTTAQAEVAANPDVTFDPANATRAAGHLRALRDALEPADPPVVSLAISLLRAGLTASQQAARAVALAELAHRLAGFVPATAARPSIHCGDAEILPTALVLETFAKHADKFFKFLIGDYRRAKPGATAYLAKTGVLPSKAAAQEHAAHLRAANVWREIDTAWSVLPSGTFSAATTGGEVDAAASRIGAAARVAEAIEAAQSAGLGPFAARLMEVESESAKSELIERVSRAAALLDAIVKAQDELKALTPWLPPPRITTLSTKGLVPPKLALGVLEGLRRGLDDFERLEAWDAVYGTLTPEARAMVEALRAGRVGDGALAWRTAIESGVYGWWLDRIERDAPVLRDVARRETEGLRTSLADAIRERRVKMRELLAGELLQRSLDARFPPGQQFDKRFSPDKPWRDLAYQVGKKSRHFSLRRLYAELGWPLMNVMPCWLVSPETMSAVFPNTTGVFDLVIFDEASQCPVEHGLPAAARAARIVVAGDEQQLRPNDLFRSSSAGDDEDPDAEADGTDTAATEAESLLTLAKARYPGRMLMWHYRSKYEELIDFSNHGFYQARLKTIPDRSAVREPPPIEYVRVEGLWEDRRNRREASAVVDLLYDRLRGEWEKKTVGVVTFGVSQRVAIEEEIEHRRSLDEEFDTVLSTAFKPPGGRLDDALFVKNIENVQGDERDVILFSVGYARDTKGRMVAQFGSLSQDGGENRLNVAVSRAREQIVVVASIEPSALNVAAAKNRGPRLFRHYLEYAQAVSRANREVQAAVLRDIGGGISRGDETALAFDSPFEEQVHAALEQHNLVVRSQIGVSGYRIDLAVVDPADGSRYCLGIECDGATYHSAPSVRERDVYRQRALEMRGWKIHRIWSRNWWANKQAEIDKVLALVRGDVGSSSADSRRDLSGPLSDRHSV